MRSGLLALALSLALPAAAQTLLTPDEFLDRAESRTLTFEDWPAGGLVGVEEFLSRQHSRWVHADGHCTRGQITVEAPYVCFRYEDDPGRAHCWLPFDYEGKLLVQSPEGNVQMVTEVTRRPLICGDAPIS
ncbi:hypothetical protein [Sulfitobacter delicatus]|uniref:Protease inhibitor Inh n=1 Tax=Sulfitobacter delicatus TaxID=218672 RepID=A0A1G7LD44_9RHOB|nr:hypothetical protein [Sulfitobacter delicatus]SDF47408.1 hypothetical protein SAMN04489759_102269 [Sulfitobacter delicatus]